MNIKEIINEEIVETLSGFAGISNDEWRNAYISRINKEYDGLLTKVINNPNFEAILAKEMKFITYGKPNR